MPCRSCCLGFIRAMVDGPTPLHVIEKPTPGTGATLMVDAIATVLTGLGASVMTEGRDDEEWRKRLTAKLRQIPSLVLIDNLRHPLDSSARAAALTAPHWEDRILGASEMTRLPDPLRVDCHRQQSRILQRDGAAHRAHPARCSRRSALAAGRLSASGSYELGQSQSCPAGCRLPHPHPGLDRCRDARTARRVIGSYENWSRIMGGVLEVAGVAGFLGNLDEMLAAADGEGAVWRSFVGAWWDRFGTAEVGTGDLFEVALACEPPLPLGSGGDRSQRTRLGKALGRLRDRVFAIASRNLRVDAARHLSGCAALETRRWKERRTPESP